MESLNNKAKSLKTQIDEAADKLNIQQGEIDLSGLRSASEAPDFWQDNLKAQKTMKQISKLEQRLGPWAGLIKSIEDINDLIALKDSSMEKELEVQLVKVETDFNKLKDDLKLNGQYDNYDAIVSIYAGAGGTDAQDWAQMLLRMYSRWADKDNFKIETIDQAPGEEAGLKSVTIEISGPYAYGKLKGENGVHRLVRLSPFNSDNLRQTSFAKVDVLPKIDEPNEISIDDKELRIDVYRSGGHGGQSVNTTDSAVRVTHLPTNISIAIQNERSQLQNKELALTLLRSRLAQLQLEQHTEKLSELKGPVQSAEWGNQIRSYVLHPYKQVKDLRTGFESNEPDKILDGNLEPLIEAYLEHSIEHN